MTGELRRRYRALLWWYPAAYREERGDEIVETCLDLAAAGQRRPRFADAADLVGGGLRQHLRARRALGLADALPFAGHLALAATTTLAAVWLVLVETTPVPDDVHWHSAGPFMTLGAFAWIAWLLAPLAALAGAGRPAVACALVTTVLLIPAAAATSMARPPLFVLVPQLALGAVALAVPDRRRSPAVAAGIVAAGAAAAMAVIGGTGSPYYFVLDVLPIAALILSAAITVAGVVFVARRDSRGWWPAAVLLGPVLLLTVHALPNAQPWPPALPAGAGPSVAVALIAIATPVAALWLRGRRPRRCPTCGR